MFDIPEVTFEEIAGRDGSLALITLNRQKVLNALNLPMFLALDHLLEECATAEHIKAVIICAAEGRAFCAGGDIRYVYERKIANDASLIDLFRHEYALNKRIYHFPKPYIALMDGITMGGGAGLSIHASHRIATERLVFAMPETQIGFYPDVGATYFLSKIADKIGYYLGLSGARITHQDCLALGLVDCVVPTTSFSELIYQLADTAFERHPREMITHILNAFSVAQRDSDLFQRRQLIATCFSKKSVEDILQALEGQSDTWGQAVAVDLRKKSPTSLKVTLRALQLAEKYDFDACMKMEFRLTNRFVQGHDFFEGIRAAVIDKDQLPRWKPDTLEAVTAETVDRYFAPLEQELV